MSIRDLWTELEVESEGLEQGEWIVRRLHPESHCDIRLAVGGSPRRKALLVQVVNRAIPGSVDYPRARGFELSEVPIAGCPRTHTTLAVSLTDQAFSEVFSTLLQDIVGHLLQASSDSQVVVELVSRLKVWQCFMEKAGPDGLSPEGQRGLYGELAFLREYLMSRLIPLCAIQAWVGPTGAQQDFQWQRRACEVKTTASKQHQKLRISNELQLDTGSLEVLWLYHLSLDVHRESGETLPQAIETIRSSFAHDPAASDLFAVRLLESGYHSGHAERYSTTGYAVRNATFYLVRDGFPRLIEQDLPSGVGDVSYTISVAACREFQVPVSEVKALIGT
jgi:hypothetical protein